ncbi:MAG: FtsX-like permease family protein [Bacteroidota bacterium]
MISFLFRGILRDSQRSRLPVIIIASGVMLTVVLSAWMTGILGDVVDLSAKFTTGHVKIMTRAYAENESQMPNDLAILGVAELKDQLNQDYPDMEWVERIHFGGLMDLPDQNGETKAQGPVSGLAVDLFDERSGESERLAITKSLQSGRVPTKSKEILVSDAFAKKIDLQLGDEITFFGSTMNGSMTFQNFNVVGTVSFGSAALDRGGIIVDLSDAKQVLDMEDAAGELLGYLPGGKYNDKKAASFAAAFNEKYADNPDEFAPTMLALRDQNDLATILDYTDIIGTIFVSIFVFAMSIVLWNTGLLGGLRRYKEFGIRLALGESKSHIYKTQIYESILIGLIGSVFGTLLGLGLAFYLQEVGLDFSELTKNAAGGMMLPSVYRANIQPSAFYLGFIPGLFSMVLGTALSGIGIFKRNTAQLFKELEV